MKNDAIKRNYVLRDSKLLFFASFLSSLIIRDIEEFEKYGVTAAQATELDSLCEELKNFPIDTAYFYDYVISIEERDAIIKDLRAIIKSMAMRVELKWGKRSPKYRWMGMSDLIKISVETFVARARIIHTFMTENLSELTAEGLTQAMLDNLDAKILELNAAISQALEKENLRQEKTKERIILSNQIYKLVSKYCEIGKMSWSNTNPAKYNDYLIYKGNK
jgi:hypothetical protein